MSDVSDDDFSDTENDRMTPVTFCIEENKQVSMLYDLYNDFVREGSEDPIYIIYRLIEHNNNITHEDITNTPSNKEFIIKIDGSLTIKEIVLNIVEMYDVTLGFHNETKSCIYEDIEEYDKAKLCEMYMNLRQKYGKTKKIELAHRLDKFDPKFTDISNQWSLDFFNELQTPSNNARFYGICWGS